MHKLQHRVVIAAGLMAVAAVAAVAWAARRGTQVEFQHFQDVERRVSGRSRAAVDGVIAALDHRCCDATSVAAAQRALAPGDAFVVIGPDGAVRATAGFGVDAANLQARVSGDELALTGRGSAPGAAVAVSLVVRGDPVAEVTLADGSRARAYVVAAPLDPVRPASEFLSSVDRRLIAATAIAAILALAAIWTVTGRMLRPIADLRAAADDVARGHFSRRVAVTGRDELAGLAQRFNAMAAELERQETLRRNLVHDVAHELRTPLTAMRCRIETLADGLTADPGAALREMQEDAAHLSQLVADLDELARAEAGELAMTIADVPLGEVCRSAIRAAGLDDDPRVRIEAAPDAAARADLVRVRQIATNLLTNAARHCPPGGRITVRVQAVGADVQLEVHNTGSTLAAEDLARVYDRFYRVDPARQRATGGTGLGLAIVKHLTEAQGGRVEASSDASGVAFRVRLPAA